MAARLTKRQARRECIGFELTATAVTIINVQYLIQYKPMQGGFRLQSAASSHPLHATSPLFAVLVAVIANATIILLMHRFCLKSIFPSAVNKKILNIN